MVTDIYWAQVLVETVDLTGCMLSMCTLTSLFFSEPLLLRLALCQKVECNSCVSCLSLEGLLSDAL